MLPAHRRATRTSLFRRKAKNTNRSAVSNGRLLAGVDLRSATARRFRDLVQAHVADLGGPEGLSELQRQLIRRVATMAVACEQIEGRMAGGETLDLPTLELYGRYVDRMSRAINKLGLKRATPPEQTLEQYLAKKHGQREAS
jgi:hypothetical protein